MDRGDKLFFVALFLTVCVIVALILNATAYTERLKAECMAEGHPEYICYSYIYGRGN